MHRRYNTHQLHSFLFRAPPYCRLHSFTQTRHETIISILIPHVAGRLLSLPHFFYLHLQSLLQIYTIVEPSAWHHIRLLISTITTSTQRSSIRRNTLFSNYSLSRHRAVLYLPAIAILTSPDNDVHSTILHLPPDAIATFQTTRRACSTFQTS